MKLSVGQKQRLSIALAGSSPHDAFIVRRLKAAGAIILAKANLQRVGQLPVDRLVQRLERDRRPDRTCPTSSIGTPAGRAPARAWQRPLTSRPQRSARKRTARSSRPSGANGDVGIKPTLGLLSRNGIIPISANQDTAGPIARNVTDAAVLLGAMTGIDPRDPATAAQRGNAHMSYRRYLDKDALDGARIGIWRNGTHDPANAAVDAMVNALMDDVAATLRAQGATVIDPADIDIGVANTTEFPALLCEFKSDIATYLRTFTRAKYPKTLAELIKFNDAHPALEGPWDSDLWRSAEATGGRDARVPRFAPRRRPRPAPASTTRSPPTTSTPSSGRRTARLGSRIP